MDSTFLPQKIYFAVIRKSDPGKGDERQREHPDEFFGISKGRSSRPIRTGPTFLLGCSPKRPELRQKHAHTHMAGE